MDVFPGEQGAGEGGGVLASARASQMLLMSRSKIDHHRLWPRGERG